MEGASLVIGRLAVHPEKRLHLIDPRLCFPFYRREQIAWATKKFLCDDAKKEARLLSCLV